MLNSAKHRVQLPKILVASVVRTVTGVFFLSLATSVCLAQNGGPFHNQTIDIRKKLLEDTEKLVASIEKIDGGKFNEYVDGLADFIQLIDKNNVDIFGRYLRRGNKARTQVALVEAIRYLSNKRSYEALEFELKNGKLGSRRAVTHALGYLGDERAVPILYQVLSRTNLGSVYLLPEEDFLIRMYAATSLLRIGTPNAIQALKSALSLRSGAEENIRTLVEWLLEGRDKKAVDKFYSSKDFQRGVFKRYYYKGQQFFFYAPVQKKQIKRFDGTKFVFDTKPRKLMVCIHGRDLNVTDLGADCLAIAKRKEFALLVPVFDPLTYYQYWNFNVFDVLSKRSDKHFWGLVGYLGGNVGIDTKEIFGIGINGGATFLQKLVLTSPKSFGRVYLSSNELTQIDGTNYFPKGIKTSPVNPFADDIVFDLNSLVRAPLTIGVPALTFSNAKLRRKSPGWRFYTDIANLAVSKGSTSLCECGDE